MSREQHQLSFSQGKKSRHQDRIPMRAQASLTGRELGQHEDLTFQHQQGTHQHDTGHISAFIHTGTVSQTIHETALVALTISLSTMYGYRGTKL